MQSQCFIQKQMQGLLLTEHNDHKIEYQLKSNTGRIFMVFDREDRAREEAFNRGLACFRVTIITEKL